jgi:Tol biopolymer transport system component
MAISPGARLGPYEIVSPLGVGGMGEVYRARDTKLGRDVAVKVLPADVSQDAVRLARFQREAQLLATLNHTNIASIYGLEDTDGVRALVMELVEGQTLEERLRASLPLDESLDIARKIAEALEYAHDRGVVHRDLKPANVKITPDDAVKVLDFGLAKAVEPDGSGSGASGAGLTHSPTMSVAATQAGVILGTAAYMSPEQARGKTVDRRADIWAFGVVLYEMLARRRLFSGETISDTLAAVLKTDPDWSALPEALPAGVRRLLGRCLERDPRQRLQAIGEARIALERAIGGAPETGAVAPSGAKPGAARLGWIVAGLLALILAAAGIVAVLRWPRAANLEAVRFVVLPPENTTFSPRTTSVMLSPDGRSLAFLVARDGVDQLWLRPIEGLTARPLDGTAGAMLPSWSPDSKSLVFFADKKLRRIEVAGGALQTICDAPDLHNGSRFGGPSWNREGVLVFARSDATGLFKVGAGGGEPTPVTSLASTPGDTSHSRPCFLPDGRHFLFLAKPSGTIWIGSLDSKDVKILLKSDTQVIYAPPGYVLFMRQGVLMAQRFDPARLELSGDAQPVAEQVRANANGMTVSVSENGLLAYRSGASRELSRLQWFDRAGKVLDTVKAPPNTYSGLSLSSDGRHIAVHRREGISGGDVWVISEGRDVLTRVTFIPAHNQAPVWSPDGAQIAFRSGTERGPSSLYRRLASGAGTDELLLKSDLPVWGTDWSRDGRFLVYDVNDPKTKGDIWLLPLTGPKTPQPFLATAFDERVGRLSPDGRWMAYQSDESGAYEIFVQSVPPSGAKVQISAGGGTFPVWRRDGREIYYRAGNGTLMAVEVKTAAGTLEPGSRVQLFNPRSPAGTQGNLQFDASADGQRFLALAAAEEAVSAPITVVVNWTALLRAR